MQVGLARALSTLSSMWLHLASLDAGPPAGGGAAAAPEAARGRWAAVAGTWEAMAPLALRLASRGARAALATAYTSAAGLLAALQPPPLSQPAAERDAPPSIARAGVGGAAHLHLHPGAGRPAAATSTGTLRAAPGDSADGAGAAAAPTGGALGPAAWGPAEASAYRRAAGLLADLVAWSGAALEEPDYDARLRGYAGLQPAAWLSMGRGPVGEKAGPDRCVAPIAFMGRLWMDGQADGWVGERWVGAT
jgi:hypothetical protein